MCKGQYWQYIDCDMYLNLGIVCWKKKFVVFVCTWVVFYCRQCLDLSYKRRVEPRFVSWQLLWSDVILVCVLVDHRFLHSDGNHVLLYLCGRSYGCLLWGPVRGIINKRGFQISDLLSVTLILRLNTLARTMVISGKYSNGSLNLFLMKFWSKMAELSRMFNKCYA
mgnify:FL=1